MAQKVNSMPVIQETGVQSLGGEDSPREGNGYPLQYSCLDNSTGRGACWATVHEVAKSQTPTERLTHPLSPHCMNVSHRAHSQK